MRSAHTWCIAPSWLFTIISLLLAAANSEDSDATCTSQSTGCSDGQIQSNSLLQLKTPLTRGSEAFGGTSDLEHQMALLSRQQQIEAILRSSGQSSQLGQSAGLESFRQMELGHQAELQLGHQAEQLSSENSEALSAALGVEVLNSMQSAAEDAKNAQLAIAEDAKKVAKTAEAMQEAQQQNHDAQVAQGQEQKQAAEASNALMGALQRVQRAGEVESQELAMEEVATKRLQDAAVGARQVQALEDEGAAREARAAELLQEAIHKLDSPDDEDTTSPLKQTLRVVEEAQRAVAAEASSKVHASQLLRSSLEGAATAVEALKQGKEAQTNKWLRDALTNLEWMQASWGQRGEAESKVTKNLEGAATSSGTAKNLIDEVWANRRSVASLLDDAVKKVQSAEDSASEEATMVALARKNAQTREAQNSAELQEAMKRLQALEQQNSAFQMPSTQEAMKSAQLAGQLQGLMQNTRASTDVQQPQMMQAVQQITQALGSQPTPPFQMLPPAQPILPQQMIQTGAQLAPPNNNYMAPSNNNYMQGVPFAQPMVAVR